MFGGIRNSFPVISDEEKKSAPEENDDEKLDGLKSQSWVLKEVWSRANTNHWSSIS